MRPIHSTALAAVACGLLALARTTESRAGTVERLGLADLAERADLAFEGRVLATRVLEPAPGRIETEYTLREHVAHVGDACALRVVRLPGGVLPDGRGLAIAGLPRLEVGADVLLFLSREGSIGTRMPVGLAQGALRVVTLASGAKRLVGSSAGLDFVGASPSAVAGGAGGATTAFAGGASGSATAIPDGVGLDYVAGLAEIASGIAARSGR